MIRIIQKNFNAGITNNADATVRVFEEPHLGRPFFHADVTNPDVIVFTNTNKYASVSHDAIRLKDVHTAEPVTVELLKAMGFTASQPYMPHYIFENYDAFDRSLYFRDSSDPDAVSITYITTDGHRADKRMIFVNAMYGNKIDTAAVTHRYNSSYERYKL